MNCCRFRNRTLTISICALAIAGLLTFTTGALTHVAYGGNSTSQTMWYSENGSSEATGNAASQANTANDKISTAAYARELSTVFHDAAEKVLPSVVMITNTPAVVERSNKKGTSPDENSRDYSFGFKGTPFGDLFNNPQFRQFFKELPECPRCRGTGSWAPDRELSLIRQASF